MSLKLTTQYEWRKHSNYSGNHPDNLHRKVDVSLPDAVKGPPPVAEITELDKKMKGAWGSKLVCERPYGKNETRSWIKDAVSPKVGRSWGATVHTEQAKSQMNSAMFAGSLIDPSFKDMIENGAAFT